MSSAALASRSQQVYSNFTFRISRSLCVIDCASDVAHIDARHFTKRNAAIPLHTSQFVRLFLNSRQLVVSIAVGAQRRRQRC